MILTRIGQKFEGGYFAGVIRVRDCAYLILVAPKSTECSIHFKTHLECTLVTHLVNNGWLNTKLLNDSEHPAAHYCSNLNVGGHTDWYLPSLNELELCYRNLKPLDRSNITCPAGSYTGNLGLANGTNLDSIPTGAAYTETNPTQTIVTAFWTSGIEAFDTDWYWTSTASSSSTIGSLIQHFSNGYQNWFNKTDVTKVRGVRRVPILLNDEKHNDTN